MFETPDLSKEYHPVPKPLAKQKKPQKPISSGKKVAAWNSGRQDLKIVFRDNGVVECEVKFEKCKIKNFLGFAHIKPRNLLTDDQIVDPHFVVLACQPCHEQLDFKMQHHEATVIMENIVKARGW